MKIHFVRQGQLGSKKENLHNEAGKKIPEFAVVTVENLRALLKGAAPLSKPQREMFEEWWAENKQDLKKVYRATNKSKDIIGLAYLAGFQRKNKELLAELEGKKNKEVIR